MNGHSGRQDQLDASNVQNTDPDRSRYKVPTFASGHEVINNLPDRVLLHIFDLIRMDASPLQWQWWPWNRLVHVCQRWRSLIFASSNLLNLKRVFEPVTPLEFLDISPRLPIIIRNLNRPRNSDYNFDSVLMHRDRISAIHLYYYRTSQLERLVSAMQGQFPALTYLRLHYFQYHPNRRPSAPALPVRFLGGHAPQLQTLELCCVPFPALPTLLLSATDLVRLTLLSVPHSGYISPETMVTCLSALTNLESLTIHFQSPSSRPDQKTRPPPLTRHVLPALKLFHFAGISEYLEDVVSQIDTPVLDTFHAIFFNQIVFDIPHFSHFISHTDNLKPYRRVSVFFDLHAIFINVLTTNGFEGLFEGLKIGIMCKRTDWQFSALLQMCDGQAPPLMPIISGVENLDISEGRVGTNGHIDVDSKQWSEFLRPFIAVKTLHLSARLMPFIMPVLIEEVQEILPALRILDCFPSVPEPFPQDIAEPFLTARQALGNPVVFDQWWR